MARGHPDFGATAPRELTTPQLDSGELAARLGSVDVYDRLGTVLALYTGDEPVAPIVEVVVGSGRRDNFVASTPFGPYVWRLTASADGQRPGVRFKVPYIGDSPTGVEVVFRKVATSSITPTLTLTADNDTAATRGGVRWEDEGNTWQYLDSAGVWTSTPTQPPRPPATVWSTLKFAVDPVTQLYGRSLFDGVSHALAGIAADDQATDNRSLEVDFYAEGNVAAAVSVDVAAVIVTVNEM